MFNEAPVGPIAGRSRLRTFASSDAFPGVLLLLATAVALTWANSRFSGSYESLFTTSVTLGWDAVSLTKPLLLWINDGLMAVFFFLIGLEIKREIVEGELSTMREAALPLAAALGGMVVPALLYLTFNLGGEGSRGWGVPMATDIAFALGVLALIASRAPLALKVFLTAVAVVDDLGAVAVIALFYTDEISVQALVLAGAILVALLALNRARFTNLAPYLLLGVVLWVAVLQSGVHATVAGVALALTIPMAGPRGETPLVDLEHTLHPWVMKVVVPVFALANAGVVIGEGGAGLLGPVSLGVMAGLVLGKPIGIVGMAWLAVRLGWARRPQGITWTHIAAAGMLSGIGFTMSLFIGQLAFGGGALLESAKIGVMAASAISATGGAVLLRRAGTRARSDHSTSAIGDASAGAGRSLEAV